MEQELDQHLEQYLAPGGILVTEMVTEIATRDEDGDEIGRYEISRY